MKRKGKKILSPAVAVMLMLLLIGCGGGGSDSDGDDASNDRNLHDNQDNGSITAENTPARIDITGARSLILTGESQYAGALSVPGTVVATEVDSALDPYSLYKMDRDGNLIRVAVMNDTGAEISRDVLKPEKVKDLSDRFTMIKFRNPQGLDESTRWLNVLVDKTTGEVYKAQSLPFPEDIRWVDPWDNGLYIAGNVDVAGNPNSLEGTLFVLTELENGGFEASTLPTGPIGPGVVAGDNSASFVTYTEAKLNSSDPQRRFISLNTETPLLTNIYTIPGERWSDGTEKQVTPFTVKGLDGEVYVFTSTHVHSDEVIETYKLGADPDGKPTFSHTDIQAELSTNIDPGYHRPALIKNKLFYMAENSNGYPFPIEVDIEGKRIFEHGPDLELNIFSTRYIRLSSNYIWYLGDSEQTHLKHVVRYDPITKEVVDFGSGALEISEIEVVAGDKVLVTGFSTEVQGDVKGYLSEDQSFEPIDVFNRFSKQIIQLEPLM